MWARRLLAIFAVMPVGAALLDACVGEDPQPLLAPQDDAGSSVVSPSAEAASPVGDDGGSLKDAASIDDGGAEAGACRDLDNDEKNCGTCGHVCTGGHGCFRGVCGNVPVMVRGGFGGAHFCALLADGTVWCWGANDRGQLGIDDPTLTNRNVATRVTKDDGANVFDHVIDLTVGSKHTCAIKDDKSLYCWGDNSYLQVSGSPSTELLRAPSKRALTGVQLVRAGGQHTCAVDGSRGVLCWGSNLDGILGHQAGTLTDTVCPPATATTPCSGSPTAVIGISNTQDLVLGEAHSCALTAGVGTVDCWGENAYAQLATDGGARATPGSVDIPPSAALFGSARSVCALDSTGTLRCWGGNGSGELANGSKGTLEPPSPWGPDGGAQVLASASGSVESICVSTKGGAAFCAGFNFLGECGDGTFNGPTSTFFHLAPSAVVGPDGGAATLTDIVLVASAMQTNCALAKAGGIYCWGAGPLGQLGDGTNTDKVARPTRVVGFPP